ncbi:MAG: glycosyltransferase [Tepidisphaeraceae bacterium]
MATTEHLLLGAYVAVGPAAWGIYGYLMTVARERMTRLKHSRAVLPADAPLVSILIPAKDEGAHIRTCVQRVLQQDYPAFEVIAVNDRSEDDTGPILDEIAAQGSRVRVVHIPLLPLGWLGKCHALERGAEHARGQWLFFVDSDVKLNPDALSRMMALALSRNYDAMSIMTAIEAHRFIEKLMLPLLAGTWMTVFAGDQTNEESEKEKALANGQAMLIRAEAYFTAGGHAAVKDRIVEDVELMRLLKQKGSRTRFFAGRHLASTRMHTDLRQMFNGWARIFAGTARGRVWPMVAAILFLVVSVLSVYPALGYAIAARSAAWGAAAGVHWLTMTIICSLIWVWSGNSPAFALLLPISVPIELAILSFSIRKAFSGQIDWRGSSVNVRETSRHPQKAAD